MKFSKFINGDWIKIRKRGDDRGGTIIRLSRVVFLVARILGRSSFGLLVFWVVRLLGCSSFVSFVFWVARILGRSSFGLLVFCVVRLLGCSYFGSLVFLVARLKSLQTPTALETPFSFHFILLFYTWRPIGS